MPNAQKEYILEDGTFSSSISDKSHIYYLHYLPKGKTPKKFIHLVFQHGMIEYYKRHEIFFEALIDHFKQDIIISTMDLIGHGRSGGHRAYIDSFDNFTDDWIQFLSICKDKFYEEDCEIETVVVAHSLGGLIVINTLTNEEIELPIEINSLILTNPSIAPKLKLPKFVENMANKIPLSLSKLRVPLIYDAYDLTHDKERAIAFMHDQLISNFITLNLGVETFNTTKNITRHSYFFKYHTLFILSGDDRIVDNEKTQLFITGMDKDKVKVLNYDNMCHDILNETCRNEVFREIINYIELRTGISA